MPSTSTVLDQAVRPPNACQPCSIASKSLAGCTETMSTHSLPRYLCEERITYLVCLSSLDTLAGERPCSYIGLGRDVSTTDHHIARPIIRTVQPGLPGHGLDRSSATGIRHCPNMSGWECQESRSLRRAPDPLYGCPHLSLRQHGRGEISDISRVPRISRRRSSGEY